MHLSATEAALLGAAIAAVGGPISAFGTQRATRKREQAARVWEGSRDVYHFVLAVADEWKSMRDQAVRMYAANEVEMISSDSGIDHNSDATRRLWVDLRLYAVDEVQKAFANYLEADKKWFIAHAEWYQARNPGYHGPIAFDEAGFKDEKGLRKTAEQAAQASNVEQERLEKAVWNAIHHPKKYKRKS
jgi:hypothetical protein